MINLFKQELGEIYSFFKNNYKETVVLCASTLFFVLAISRPIGPSLVINYLVYYAILPIFTILFILRKNPLDFGLRLGDYKLWSFYVTITVIIAVPVLYIGSLFSSVNLYYSKPFDFYSFFIRMVPLLLVWEFILRGFILFGLKERFKEASIIIQMVPFVLLHIGKPEVEILMCIPMGLWFGYIAYRGKSFWPAFITHTFINFTLSYFVNF